MPYHLLLLAASPTNPPIENNNTVSSFINNAKAQNEGTAREYKNRIRSFGSFVRETYDITLDELVEILTVTTTKVQRHRSKNNARTKIGIVNVYQVLSDYVAWLIKRGSMSPRSIKTWLSTARHFLETNDVEIAQRKFQLKVKTPRIIRKSKEAITKEDIQIILNACPSLKLKTYVLFLAATGCRATESLSIRLCDLNFETDPPTAFIRGQYTKTKVDKYIPLTRELAEQLQSWIKYKYRTRTIGYYDNDKKISINKVVKPTINDQILIFTSSWEKDPTLDALYNNMLYRFERVLDRLGGKFAEHEDDEKKRRKIHFHSFRAFVKSTISDLGLSDYSEYYITHHASVYWQRSQKEKNELFRKVEPYLTYLDFSSLERHGADIRTKMDAIEKENIELKKDINKIMEMIQQNPKLAQVKPEALRKKL
jgi:integrase